MNETSIRFHGNAGSSPEGKLLWRSFIQALALDTKLPETIVTLRGMSGRKYRYLINNLVGAMENARYLEIGCWLGSTTCAAIYGNKLDVLCIDNWSQFGDPREEFLQNVNAAKNEAVNFRFMEADFRSIDYSKIGRFNVYMFDGPHLEKDQYDGVRLAQPALDQTSIYIVDDWNYLSVRKGTSDAIRDEKLDVLFSITIRTMQDDTFDPSQDAEQPVITNHRQIQVPISDWHNGYFLAACRKPPVS
jgi:SAM-dependent methyltransferase